MTRRDDETHDPVRREAVFFIGSFAAATMLGCGEGVTATSLPTGASSPSPGASPATSASSCLVRPQLTEGPYFVDEKLNRSDIRTDPGSGALRPGLPLRLTFRVSRSSGSSCSAFSGAFVDVWHCDALGVYSDVDNARGQRFLRGYQATDGSGVAQFTTIFPGWYQGRAVHIHFKIRTSLAGAGQEFTSQLFFDEAVISQVHSQSPYNQKGTRDTPNARDGIYQGGGSQLVLPIAAEGSGLGATFDIALLL
jgi:protocatechuate 3,4-dioxygenase beta subunit